MRNLKAFILSILISWFITSGLNIYFLSEPSDSWVDAIIHTVNLTIEFSWGFYLAWVCIFFITGTGVGGLMSLKDRSTILICSSCKTKYTQGNNRRCPSCGSDVFMK